MWLSSSPSPWSSKYRNWCGSRLGWRLLSAAASASARRGSLHDPGGYLCARHTGDNAATLRRRHGGHHQWILSAAAAAGVRVSVPVSAALQQSTVSAVVNEVGMETKPSPLTKKKYTIDGVKEAIDNKKSKQISLCPNLKLKWQRKWCNGVDITHHRVNKLITRGRCKKTKLEFNFNRFKENIIVLYNLKTK